MDFLEGEDSRVEGMGSQEEVTDSQVVAAASQEEVMTFQDAVSRVALLPSKTFDVFCLM